MSVMKMTIFYDARVSFSKDHICNACPEDFTLQESSDAHDTAQ
jgi:hypothetical protein